MSSDLFLDAGATRVLLQAVARHVIAHVDLLTDADLATGDGDHGIGMRRGFEAALLALDGDRQAGVEAQFRLVGSAIMAETGGAAGAVFGTLFRAGAKAFAAQDRLDAGGFGHFVSAGLEAVQKRGGVVPGQKTMVDALAPVAQALRDAGSGPIGPALALAATAARRGMEATRDMVATTGKARSLGPRSIGHLDPGAITVVLIFEAMRDAASQPR